jgi:hypothetical protein
VRASAPEWREITGEAGRVNLKLTAKVGGQRAWNTLVKGRLLLMQQATLIDDRYSLLKLLGSGGWVAFIWHATNPCVARLP